MTLRVLMSSEQCRAARALLDWPQSELASRTGVTRATIGVFERGQLIRPSTRHRLQQALEDAGVIFLRADHHGGEGVTLGRTASERPARQRFVFDRSFYEDQAQRLAVAGTTVE
jgi:transcriptional regulator with XRE-family HTH domain